MNDPALQAYEDWRARFLAGQPCPGLAALRQRGMLAALRAACPRPAVSRSAPAADPRTDGRYPAELVSTLASMLRNLLEADSPPAARERRP